MVLKVRDRLGFLRPVRSASSASDCGDVPANRLQQLAVFRRKYPRHALRRREPHLGILRDDKVRLPREDYGFSRAGTLLNSACASSTPPAIGRKAISFAAR